MMASWPSSTPRLKQRSAVGTCCSGTPSSSSADAKPSPCKQAEREGDRPGRAPGERVGRAQALAADEDDGERDRRLDRRRRDVHEPEHREREADAVGERERGDGGQELPPAPHQQRERDDEEQVIEPGQDVLDAEAGVVDDDRRERAAARSREGRRPSRAGSPGWRRAGGASRSAIRRRPPRASASLPARERRSRPPAPTVRTRDVPPPADRASGRWRRCRDLRSTSGSWRASGRRSCPPSTSFSDSDAESSSWPRAAPDARARAAPSAEANSRADAAARAPSPHLRSSKR